MHSQSVKCIGKLKELCFNFAKTHIISDHLAHFISGSSLIVSSFMSKSFHGLPDYISTVIKPKLSEDNGPILALSKPVHMSSARLLSVCNPWETLSRFVNNIFVAAQFSHSCWDLKVVTTVAWNGCSGMRSGDPRFENLGKNKHVCFIIVWYIRWTLGPPHTCYHCSHVPYPATEFQLFP